MPIKTNLWKVAETPLMLADAKLASELQLEEMILREPRLLSEGWMSIGRKKYTGPGMIIDLLPLAMFGIQNIICKLTTPSWRTSVERVKFQFPGFDGWRQVTRCGQCRCNGGRGSLKC